MRDIVHDLVECILQHPPRMTITMGQLVATLFDAYDRKLHDERLAAIATQVRIAELLGVRRRPRRAPLSRKVV